MEKATLPDHIYEVTNSYLHLYVDTDVKLMYTDWLSLPSSAEYREAAALFVQNLQVYAVENWVMDSNRLAGFSLAEQRQVIAQLAPTIAASSLKKVARIISQDIHNRAMFEEMVKDLKNKHQAQVEIKQFWTYNEAAHWITLILA